MVEPYKFSEINLNKLIYSKPKQSGSKKVVLIKYNDNDKARNLVFQTPTIYNLTEPDIKKGYGEIEVALHGKERNKTDDFNSFLSQIPKGSTVEVVYHPELENEYNFLEKI